jgi:hypothetical protein
MLKRIHFRKWMSASSDRWGLPVQLSPLERAISITGQPTNQPIKIIITGTAHREAVYGTNNSALSCLGGVRSLSVQCMFECSGCRDWELKRMWILVLCWYGVSGLMIFLFLLFVSIYAWSLPFLFIICLHMHRIGVQYQTFIYERKDGADGFHSHDPSLCFTVKILWMRRLWCRMAVQELFK